MSKLGQQEKVEFNKGDKVIAYIKEIDTYAKGEVEALFNAHHSTIDFGNLFFALVPNLYDNSWTLPNSDLEKITDDQ